MSRTTYDGLDGSTVTLGGGVGYQVPLDRKEQFQLCPIASVAFALGPNNVDLSGNGLDGAAKTFHVSVSLNVGRYAPSNSNNNPSSES